jgi:hypothetical protein
MWVVINYTRPELLTEAQASQVGSCVIVSPKSITLCLSYSSYDFFKAALLIRPLPVINCQLEDTLPVHLISSCAAGMFATSWVLHYEKLCSRCSSSNLSGLLSRRRHQIKINGSCKPSPEYCVSSD